MALMKFSLLEKRGPLFWLSASIGLLAMLGFLDYLTGPEIASSLFYLIPISMGSWYVGRKQGIALSFIGAAVWLAADIASRSIQQSALLYGWNAMVRLVFFLVVSLLLAALRLRLDREKEMARTDYLTGAVNSRFFYELVEMEIHRSLRSQNPFSAAYIDLDHFKAVNDRLGHLSGDQVLKHVVGSVRELMRVTDVVARLGGDEFVLLMPETGEEGAREAIDRIRTRLLDEMRAHDWPVTFSIGAMTFGRPPHSADEIIRLTDDLMYAVKKSGRNAVKYQIYSDSAMENR